MGSLVTRMDGSEAGGDGGAATKREKQTAGSNEVAVEALAEAADAGDDDERDGPVGADGVFKSDGSGEGFAEKRLPGGGERDGDDGENVKAGADEESEDDGAEETARGEAGMSLLGNFRNGFETGHEIRDDLQSEQDGKEWSGAEGGMDVGE